MSEAGESTITVEIQQEKPSDDIKLSEGVLDTLSPEEQKMLDRYEDLSGKKIEEKSEEKEDDKVEEEEASKEEADESVLKEKATDILDKLTKGEITEEEEHESVSALTAREKGFYFRTKKEVAKRQEAQAKEEKARIELGLAKKEIEKLKAKPKKKVDDDDDDIFKDDDDDTEDTNEKDYLTRADLERIEQEKSAKITEFNENIKKWNTEGRDKYADYDEITTLGQMLVDQDAKYAKQIHNAFNSPEDFHPGETLYDIGIIAKAKGLKIKSSKSDEGKDQDIDSDKSKAQRVIKNSKKRVSSASLSSDQKTLRVSADELTAEQLLSLSDKEFTKVPKHIRERILRELES